MMEDRRRRSIAFENLAKEMRRHLDKSEAVKVGITELQQRPEVPEKSVFLFGKCLNRRRAKMARICLGKEKKR